MGRQGFFKDEWAVSETVGFIIIFGIVMAGIGLVTLYGYPALLNQQAAANIGNMEKSLIVLQTDINALAFKNVPYQETTIQVADGTLILVNSDAAYDKRFSIDNETDTIISNFKPGELRYISSTENVNVGLQNGAIVKWQVGGSTMLAKPRWYLDSSTSTKTLVVNLIQINSDSPFSLSGIGTVAMEIKESSSPIVHDYTPAQDITITYSDTGDYLTAWRNYFREFEPSAGTTLSISDVDKLVIKEYDVKVSLL